MKEVPVIWSTMLLASFFTNRMRRKNIWKKMEIFHICSLELVFSTSQSLINQFCKFSRVLCKQEMRIVDHSSKVEHKETHVIREGEAVVAKILLWRFHADLRGREHGCRTWIYLQIFNFITHLKSKYFFRKNTLYWMVDWPNTLRSMQNQQKCFNFFEQTYVTLFVKHAMIYKNFHSNRIICYRRWFQ